MKLIDILSEISKRPVGTKYECKETKNGYVVLKENNEIFLDIAGVTFNVINGYGLELLLSNKWKYQVKTFDFSEALKHIKNGKFVSRLIWEKNICIGYPGGFNIYFYTYFPDKDVYETNEKMSVYNPTQEDMLATDWCIHAERMC